MRSIAPGDDDSTAGYLTNPIDPPSRRLSGADQSEEGPRQQPEPGLVVIDSSGSIAPLDLNTIAQADRTMHFNQRFARKWEITDGTLERIKAEHELRRALERDEFEVYLQPQAAVGTNEVVGAEALVRWRHPERGLVLPDEFIPIAEESGLIIQLGEQVLRQACEHAARRVRAGLSFARVAVNLSAVQFREPGLVELVAAVLRDTALDPRMLELEVTESTAMHQAEVATAIMHDLNSLGVKISLDDFGAGYSSLQYLREFPIDALKIDRSFMSRVPVERSCREIVAAVISIAHSLELKVIAEGVETASQLAFLKERGCGWYQGFLLAKPMPQDAFDSMLKTQAA